ncbi:MAG: hypothetical protein KGL46_01545 [Hyphomicrobiales bacterium]|nr:hypothetical protein [Hyphomicrobiales bacterium]
MQAFLFRVCSLLFLTVAILAGAGQAFAQSSTPGATFGQSFGGPLRGSFDHATTSFPLTGAHSAVACESCHAGGKFKNTPRTCFGCHNGSVAAARPPTHPQTTQQCSGCHTPGGWTDLKVIDHTQASAKCSTCHNGVIAKAKPPGHIPTVAPCEMCHKTTTNFTVAVKMDHTGIVSGCATCHNNVNALGKPANHIQTTLPCEACHKSTVTFAGAYYQHAPGDTDCASCHNGKTAIGPKTPPHIPVAGVQCSNCHSNTAPSFASYSMNHPAVSGQRCDACHNGAFTGQGAQGAQGTASYPGHLVFENDPAQKDKIMAAAKDLGLN